jgi:3-oxoacyl-[acyl-carrier protein] reductase
MSFDFSGRRIIITGGSRSIGRAMALAFARAGASVSICARGEDALAAVGAELEAIGPPSHWAVCDLADGDAITAYVAAAATALGGVDIVINNATRLARGHADEDWAADFNVDLLGMVRMIRAAGPWLQASSNASVINFASVSALHPTPMAPAYGALKAAIVHMTRTEAVLQAPHHIRVNAIAPGATESDDNVWGERRRTGNPTLARKEAQMPFGRLARPEDIADVALFLASDMARWITGQLIAVDGGESLVH